ncbi:cytospin-B-like isoform X3 [Hemiscyllium ocellatum]|uniref:cytospin-B-like isoform X3 n=1 Tax=Hemiscyllium ocellatum TaxID=170820 RepID=UPI0029669782|nr:cytospin-B-like isoform X3 [Hemiscyllium ocellatum]
MSERSKTPGLFTLEKRNYRTPRVDCFKGLSCSHRRSAIPTPRDSTTPGKDKLVRERFRIPPGKKAAASLSCDAAAPTRALPTALRSRSQGEESVQARLETQIKALLAEAKAKDFEISKLRCELNQQQNKHEKNDLEELSGFPGKADSQIKTLEQKNQILQNELEETRAERHILQEQLLTLEHLREGVQSVTEGNSLSLEVSLCSDPSSSLCTPSSLESTRNHTRESFDNTLLAVNGGRSLSSFSNMSSVTPYPDSKDLNRVFDPSLMSTNGVEGNISSSQEPLRYTGSVSGDCLAEKLHQMEEKQHCTTEELQATLQELSDQQQLVQELTAENEKLLGEKANLESSFQLQQERLQQLIRGKEKLLSPLQESPQVNTGTALADSVQPHEGKLFTTQQSVSNYLTLQEEKPGTEVQLESLRYEVRTLQKVLKAEQERNASLTDSLAESQTENTGLRNQLKKHRLLELEKDVTVNAKLGQSDREEVDCAALSHNSLQATNAGTPLHNPSAKVQSEQLEEPCLPADRLQGETRNRESEIKDMKETIFELQDHVEQLQTVQLHNNRTILDLEGKVTTLEQQKRELEKQLKMSNKKMKEEAEEWRHFQADLQTAVVVANEIKCEAQQEIHVLKRKLQEAEQGMELLQQELEELRGLILPKCEANLSR